MKVSLSLATTPRRVHAALLACVGLLGACSPATVNLREGSREYVAPDYENVFSQWTRNEHLIAISELDDLLSATATFESWDFRWAYVVRYAQDYRLTLDQRQKLLEKTLDETRHHHHFFVAIAGGERKFNDLTKPNSAWIVRLIDSTGAETAPEEITAINKPNAIERTYFPYNTVFHKTFRIKFPVTSGDGRPTIAPNAEWFGLRFAGAQGNSELLWAIDKDSPVKKGGKGSPKPGDLKPPPPDNDKSSPGTTSPDNSDKVNPDKTPGDPGGTSKAPPARP